MKKFTIVLLVILMMLALTVTVFAYDFQWFDQGVEAEFPLTTDNAACSIGFWAKNDDPLNKVPDELLFNDVFANDGTYFDPGADATLQDVLEYKEKGNASKNDNGNGNYLSLAKQLSAAYMNQVYFATEEDPGLFDLLGLDLAAVWADGNVENRDVSKMIADDLIYYNAYQLVPGKEPSETACPAKSGWIK